MAAQGPSARERAEIESRWAAIRAAKAAKGPTATGHDATFNGPELDRILSTREEISPMSTTAATTATCPSGKMRYRTHGEATRSMLSLRRDGKADVQMHAYRCPHCLHWHVGHRLGSGSGQAARKAARAAREREAMAAAGWPDRPADLVGPIMRPRTSRDLAPRPEPPPMPDDAPAITSPPPAPPVNGHATAATCPDCGGPLRGKGGTRCYACKPATGRPSALTTTPRPEVVKALAASPAPAPETVPLRLVTPDFAARLAELDAARTILTTLEPLTPESRARVLAFVGTDR